MSTERTFGNENTTNDDVTVRPAGLDGTIRPADPNPQSPIPIKKIKFKFNILLKIIKYFILLFCY